MCAGISCWGDENDLDVDRHGRQTNGLARSLARFRCGLLTVSRPCDCHKLNRTYLVMLIQLN